ncbi:transcriptional regulator [Aeromonas hydrophila]|uniref:transcriptional regulator n=1 Tax=Aeromonas hydrophila TaxID=644 RepID=UPI001C049590|nr:transcriptional regulator [Aeromonas hydrophila]MBX9561603.1 transcriptional regulator [Aeromonas hydrophila]QWL80832.1 transcriptional regulator [Aeromonas hydrophila]
MDTWLEVLQAEVAASSLTVVADKLGLSRTTISQVCNQKYPGDMARVQTLVEGALMGNKVMCPILGEIPVHQCLAHQRRGPRDVGSSPMDIKLWKACRSGCPHSQLGEEQQLRRPMRISVGPNNKGMDKSARYDAEATLSRLRRQAKSDGENASSSLRILAELLAEELKILGIKYNRLLDKVEKHGQ